MTTTVDNPNNGAVAQGGNTPPAGAPQPTLQQLVQALVIQILAMPPVPGAPAGAIQYALPVGTNLKTLPKASKAQVSHGQAMLAELIALASSHDWTSTFGLLMPTADLTQGVIRSAVAWTGEETAAQQWLVQAKGNALLGWSDVLRVMTALTPALEALIVSNPDLTRTMPATSAFIRARSVTGQKAAATRASLKTSQTRATKATAEAATATTKARANAASNAILHPAPVQTPAPAPTPTPSISGTPTPPAAPSSGNGTPSP